MLEDDQALEVQEFTGQTSPGVPVSRVQVAVADDATITTSVLPPPPPPPTEDTLHPFRNLQIHGGYTAAGVGLRNLVGGNIEITDIPAGASVREAYLYTTFLDDGNLLRYVSLASMTSQSLGCALVLALTRAGAVTSIVYRTDVTTLVPGNGSYVLGDVATGNAILANGASLVVVYEKPDEPLRTVVILDGNVNFISQKTVNAPLTGFVADAAPLAKTTFVVGDGQPFPETASVSGTLGTRTLPNLCEGSDGPLWDTDTIDVSDLVGRDQPRSLRLSPSAVTVLLGPHKWRL
jgi:hypothetical protein